MLNPMGKVTIQIPHVTWRGGRPCSFPSAAQRKLGFGYADLRHPSGAWFSLDEAIAWSAGRSRAIAAARAKAAAGAGHSPPLRGRCPAGQRGVKGAPARPTLPRAAFLSLAHILARFLASPRLAGEQVVTGRKVRAGLKPATARYYRGGVRLLEADDAAADPVADLDAEALVALIERIEVGHGLAQARCARATLQAALKWARAEKLVRGDPLSGAEFDLPALPDRTRPASVAEFLAFVAAAEALGRPEAADMATLAVFHGQRQNDRLAATWRLVEGGCIGWRQGKKRQRKDGEDGAAEKPGLLIWINPLLAARLNAAQARRRGRVVQHPHLVIDEAANAPFKADWLRKIHAAVRAVAVEGFPSPPGGEGGARSAPDEGALLPPCPSLADLRDQDWRDTALSWAEWSGCTRAEIAALSGHAFGRDERVLKHYVGMDPAVSRRAAEKVWAWFQSERAKIEGEKREAVT